MVKIVLAVLLLCVAVNGIKIRSQEHVAGREQMLKYADHLEFLFMNEYNNYTETGVRSKVLTQMFDLMQIDEQFHRNEFDDLPEKYTTATCLVCRAGVGTLLRNRRNGQTEQQLKTSAIDLCKSFSSQSDEVCSGLIDLNFEALVFIVDNRPSLTGNTICSLVLQGECGEPAAELGFTINVSQGSPITQSKSQAVPRSGNDLKIVHITDVHYDPNYLAGSNADCSDPVCCRAKGGIASDPAARAGAWGDFRYCDSPWAAVEDAIRQVKRQHPDVDIVYYTGDIVDHGVWETTIQGNINIMDRTYNLFKSVFGNIPVYPILGNHEAHPTNVFAPSTIQRTTISTQWLYDYSANAWNSWLPASALQTVRRGGYYTVSPFPGFRVIAINNNDCYTFNFWILYSRDEIAEQLQWLHDTLLAAERAGEKVHILAHVPSGEGSCYKPWSREYRRVIDRFHMTISAQFNGHTHLDEFNVFYSSSDARHAVNVAWNGGGTTPYHWVNPNYIMYYVDRQIYEVINVESWIYNLTEANADDSKSPNWFKQFSLKESFELDDLSPATMTKFVDQLAGNKTKLQQYWEYKVKGSDLIMKEGCSKDCLKGL
ncbi:unnamed protein product [Diamesa hyperborea]